MVLQGERDHDLVHQGRPKARDLHVVPAVLLAAVGELDPRARPLGRSPDPDDVRPVATALELLLRDTNGERVHVESGQRVVPGLAEVRPVQEVEHPKVQEERVVGLTGQGLALAAHRGGASADHGFANTVREEPCALVSHAEHSVKLMGAHALFGCTEKMESHKPLMQRNVAVLEDRAHGDGELLAARAALPNAFTISDLAGLLWLASNRREFGGFAYKSAVRAACFAIRPALPLKELSGTIFIVVGFGYLCEVHGLNSNAQILSD